MKKGHYWEMRTERKKKYFINAFLSKHLPDANERTEARNAILNAWENSQFDSKERPGTFGNWYARVNATRNTPTIALYYTIGKN